LVRSIVGIASQHEGTVRIAGTPLKKAARDRTREQRREIQYVFQNPYASLNPRKSIEAIMGVPVKHFFSERRRAARDRIANALERVSLSTRVMSQYPEQLSGGERQRVAIARALVCEPQVMICDEITSALDVSVQAAIVELLGRLQREGEVSMLFVTHDLALVRSIADRVIVLSEGRVVEERPTESLFREPRHEYTRRLLGDTPGVTWADRSLADDTQRGRTRS
jgi:peptide/nickel transport system ATP-binding protein